MDALVYSSARDPHFAPRDARHARAESDRWPRHAQSRRRARTVSMVDRSRPPAGVMCTAAEEAYSRSSGVNEDHVVLKNSRNWRTRGTFVPVCKEMVADLLTPVSAFLKIAEHADYAFLLESVEGGEHVGRYSFLGKDPFLILRAAKSAHDSIERGAACRRRAAIGRSSRTLCAS